MIFPSDSISLQKKSQTYAVIGAALGWGAQIRETENGPDAVYASALKTKLSQWGATVQWEDILYPSKKAKEYQFPSDTPTLPLIVEYVTHLANQVIHVVRRGDFPIVVGGDHSIAIGTWSGLTHALQSKENFGLLWIDAHMDAHTPETSLSHAYNGMPVASLLGYGDSQLINITYPDSKLHPRHVILYGVRSYEDAERAFLNRLGVRIYYMKEIIQRGIDSTLTEALDYLKKNTESFGVSIDLDAFDPLEVPGVGSRKSHGLPVDETLKALSQLRHHSTWQGLEITEFNPNLDHGNKTLRTIEKIFECLIGQRDSFSKTYQIISREKQVCAANYHPLPVVLSHGQGAWLWDVEGRKYLDMLSAYSAISHGHAHPRILKVMREQAEKVSVVSRAFYSDQLEPFLRKLTELSGLEMALPVNSGAEAVETAIKAVRRWGYEKHAIPNEQAEIIVMDGNFHGRTTTLVGFSSEEGYKNHFGPFAKGFKSIPFGNIKALQEAITPYTCAVLTEPIQGEAGIIIPPQGWLGEVRQLCTQHQIPLILDEVQTGLGRTGKWFAYQHEDIKPDGLILGKALGGGILPISAFVATRDIMNVFTPGSHGSTFGGNPLAAAVGLEALNVLEEEGLIEASATLGAYFLQKLKEISSPLIQEVRGRGLWCALEIIPSKANARQICHGLLHRGILAKETHETIIRFSPPLTVEKEALDWALREIRKTLQEFC